MSVERANIEDVPEGWTMTSVRAVVHRVQYGTAVKCSAIASGTPVLRIPNVVGGSIDHRDMKYGPLSPKEMVTLALDVGDLLMIRSNGSVGLVGRTATVTVRERGFAFAGYLMRLQTNREIVVPKYLHLGLETYDTRLQIELPARSTSGVHNINTEEVKSIGLRLAPLPEQRRIVKQVEALLEHVNRAKARLDRVPLILNRFRQAVLSAACSGQLTREWRDAHGGLSAAQETRSLPALQQKREIVDVESVDDVPESWVTVPLGRAAELVDPNPSHRYPTYADGTVPLLATREFAGLSDWDLSAAPVVPTEVWEEQNRVCRFSPDDIIFARKGRLGLARRPPPVARYTFSHTIFVVKARAPVRSEYLLWFLRQQSVVDDLLHEMNSNEGVPTLGKAFMERVPLPVPPVEEQVEIARQVQQLFTLADTIERRVRAASARADKLPQAILSKAFSGELVPNEAELARAEGRTYESAKELLKRVTAAVAHPVDGVRRTRSGKPRTSRSGT